MSPEKEKLLTEKYPELYGTVNDVPIDSYIFSHGDGWYNIIDSLSMTITHTMKHHVGKKHLTPEEFADSQQVRVAQVKEKFGTLRFYVDNGNPEVQAAIQMAEVLSGRTCESCGSPGEKRGGGWVKVRCAACEAKKSVNG